MGQRGPRPKPAKLKELEGNPGKRHIEQVLVEAVGKALPPEHLNDEATACFELVKSSMPPDLYGAADTFALAAFATAWAWHKRATEELDSPANMPLVPGSTGNLQPNPWFKIQKAMSEEMRAWGDRLGLNPHARAAIKLPTAEKPKSKFEGLWSIQGGRKE